MYVTPTLYKSHKFIQQTECLNPSHEHNTKVLVPTHPKKFMFVKLIFHISPLVIPMIVQNVIVIQDGVSSFSFRSSFPVIFSPSIPDVFLSLSLSLSLSLRPSPPPTSPTSPTKTANNLRLPPSNLDKIQIKFYFKRT